MEGGEWSIRLTTTPIGSVEAEALVNIISGRLCCDKVKEDVLQVASVRSDPLGGLTPLYGGDVGPVAQKGGVVGGGAGECKIKEGAFRVGHGDGAVADIVEGAIFAHGGILIGSGWLGP